MSNLTFSAIVITHNRYQYLLKAIDSVFKQNYRPKEIIVVDNGSPINVERQYREESQVHTGIPIIFIRLENLGPSIARNTGAERASGEVLAFLDDDDMWEALYLDRVATMMDKSNSSVVITWLKNFDEKIKWNGKRITGELQNLDLYERNHGMVGSNIAIKNNSFASIGGFDSSLLGSEDKDLLIRILKAKISFSILKEDLVLYRVHGNSQASGPTIFHFLQVEGKLAFYKKYASEMTPTTRKKLKSESGYYQLMGGATMFDRLSGFTMTLTSNPFQLLHIIPDLIKRYQT